MGDQKTWKKAGGGRAFLKRESDASSEVFFVTKNAPRSEEGRTRRFFLWVRGEF
jgi:hypothetical protein